MAEKTASVEAEARHYDKLYREDYGKGGTSSHRLTLSTIARFKEKEIKTVLDVGCGRGLLIKELLARDLDVTGTEIVPVLFAKELRKLPVVMCAVQHLQDEFPGRQFDAVLAVDVLDHLSNEENVRVAVEQMGLLASKVVIASINGPFRTQSILRNYDWWEKTLIEGLSEKGFSAPVVTCEPDSGLCVFSLWREM